MSVAPTRLILLGASGSIGHSTLAVIRQYPDRFCLVAAHSHCNADLLAQLGNEFSLTHLCLSGSIDDTFKYSGAQGIERLLQETPADIVVNAISGSPGLEPSALCLRLGMDLALANKETMVMAGALIRSLAHSLGRHIRPIDSEHSALGRLIELHGRQGIQTLILTASGGPFVDRPIEDLATVSPTEALRHPTWSMGKKISLDSATMANKGLEVIEAHELFDFDYDDIEVLIHRQSKVHSLIRSCDGSLYAQVSASDMKLPILTALSWPQTPTANFTPLVLDGLCLSFEKIDNERFPMLGLAYKAGRAAMAYPIAYNAANEEAASAFLAGLIRYTDIAIVCQECLEHDWAYPVQDFESVFESDRKARAKARECLSRKVSQ